MGVGGAASAEVSLAGGIFFYCVMSVATKFQAGIQDQVNGVSSKQHLISDLIYKDGGKRICPRYYPFDTARRSIYATVPWWWGKACKVPLEDSLSRYRYRPNHFT